MARVLMVPGKTEVQLAALVRGVKIPSKLLDVPGGLYPMLSAAFEVDEYRIMSGWPVPVPDMDIRVEALVSGNGDLLGDRDEPTAVVTGADMRWVADPNYYDQTSLQWTPMQGGVTPWLTSVESAPSLIFDYEYRVGQERFVDMCALNFDSDTSDYMWNDLSLSLGGTDGYTVLMVMSPNSVYGNNEDFPVNGLWGHASGDNYIDFTVSSQSVWAETESLPTKKLLAIGDQVSSSAPTFVALVVGRPQTTVYAGLGPSNIKVGHMATGQVPVPLSTQFWLGNTGATNSATMDMALMDLGIYGRTLSASDVRAEFTELSKVYGGDG